MKYVHDIVYIVKSNHNNSKKAQEKYIEIAI